MALYILPTRVIVYYRAILITVIQTKIDALSHADGIIKHMRDANEDSPQKIEFSAFNLINQNALSEWISQELHPPADDVYLIEEGNRPGELRPIFEN
ncbi:MAG: hypothetical protein ACJAS1_006409 [Oleiphilaceae bacterium]|jgi:hypothetical protein